MTHVPSMSVHVDVRNPGQFFACCGLLELADRLWPGAEGWFSADASRFNILAATVGPGTLDYIVERLVKVGIEGELSADERSELVRLESNKRTLNKARSELPEGDEERRKALGTRFREGAVSVGEPFNLRLAWWQEDGKQIPKTFAGRQEVRRMALAMLTKLPAAVQVERPFEYRCLLEATNRDQPSIRSGTSKRTRKSAKVEPFYFDAHRFAHRLDVGFSLDVQERAIRSSAAPLTELLALIGLERFRPAAADRLGGQKASTDSWPMVRRFRYCTWVAPLACAVGAAVACGAVVAAGGGMYEFPLRYRDDQKRYKAFGFAVPTER